MSGSNSVLVIGGGAAGCAAAAELSRRGTAVTIIEAADRLGGLAALHCCKSTSRCERCDACLPRDFEREVRGASAARVLTSSNVIDAMTDDDGVLVRMATPDGEVEERFGVVIVSIGAPPFDPSLDPRLGCGTVKGVLSSLDVDRAVRAGTFSVVGEHDALLCRVGPLAVPAGKGFMKQLVDGQRVDVDLVNHAFHVKEINH